MRSLGFLAIVALSVCSANVRYFPDELKQRIVDLHNQYRSSEALAPYTAAYMEKMVWNDELAATAAQWAFQCLAGHSMRGDTG